MSCRKIIEDVYDFCVQPAFPTPHRTSKDINSVLESEMWTKMWTKMWYTPKCKYIHSELFI